MNLLLEIITPEKIVFKDEIDEAVIPTANGQITILPNHVGLLTQIKPGELIVKKGNKREYLAITDGFLEINNNHISILANYAIKAEDIQVAEQKEAQERAEKLMREKLTDRDARIAEAQLIQAVLQMQIASKYRQRNTH